MPHLDGAIVIGQSGGATAVINQTLVGAVREAKRCAGFSAVLGMRNGIEGVLNEDFIDLGRQDEKILDGLLFTPSAALGSCRYRLNENDAGKAIEIFKRHGIRYMLLIGGNDSARTSLEVEEAAKRVGYELKVVAAPKTIDNDLPEMDHTPGYGSVARFVAVTTREAGFCTEAMKKADPVKIVEVMGRNSGWIAAASALGKKTEKDAPHLIYFPERPFDSGKFIEDVKQVYGKIGWCVIVISETIRDKKGRRIAEKSGNVLEDAFGHKYVGCAAEKLCELVEKKLKVRARYDKPGTIQRMSMAYVSETDQKEAYMAGKAAANGLADGKSGIMVTLVRGSDAPYSCGTAEAPLARIASTEKYLPDDFINGDGNFITESFVDYALPLIGPRLPNFTRLGT